MFLFKCLFSKLPSEHIFVLDNWTLTQPDTRETKTGKLIWQLEGRWEVWHDGDMETGQSRWRRDFYLFYIKIMVNILNIEPSSAARWLRKPGGREQGTRPLRIPTAQTISIEWRYLPIYSIYTCIYLHLYAWPVLLVNKSDYLCIYLFIKYFI